MSTASRTANPAGGRAAGAERADMDRDAVLAGLVERHGLPLVVIDLSRAARQYRALSEAFPWVGLHYDVSALAHPALIASIAAQGGAFQVAHEEALPALTRATADLSRVLHATPATHPQETLAAYHAGVRRFVVDGARELEALAPAPEGLNAIVRLRPSLAPRPAHLAVPGLRAEDVPAVVRSATALGVEVAGLSLRLPDRATPDEYAAELAHAMRTLAAVERATGRRLRLLDLGGGFPGRAAARPAERTELARIIRAIAAPATSRLTITASAGRAVTAGCITIVGGTIERDADPATASECIDAGAGVAILRDDDRPRVLDRLLFFRAPATASHRVLRGARGRTAWSSTG